MPDLRLVAKGRKEPLDALLQQGRAHHELATKHATALQPRGWFAEDTTALAAAITQLDTDSAKQADAFEATMGLGDAEQIAIDKVKAFIRHLRNALPRGLRLAPSDAGVKISSFYAGVDLGRSTPKLSKYLNDIRPSLLKIDTTMARFFNGAAPTTLLDALKTELDTADALQEAGLAALPNETQVVYEAKGKLLEMIEDLNRAGRSAFDGDAATVAQFNKDILLRGRKSRKKTTETDPPTPAS